MVCRNGEFSVKYGIKYGGTSEIQCACVKDAPRSTRHTISWFKFKILWVKFLGPLASNDDILDIHRDHVLEWSMMET